MHVWIKRKREGEVEVWVRSHLTESEGKERERERGTEGGGGARRRCSAARPFGQGEEFPRLAVIHLSRIKFVLALTRKDIYKAFLHPR